MFHVYIVRCADDSYYTGHTEDLDARLAAHEQATMPGYTSTRLPVTLVFSAAFPTREEALHAERQIKGWSRKKKEAMMRGDWNEVSRLARGPRPVHGSTGSPRTGMGGGGSLFQAEHQRDDKEPPTSYTA